jgi:hypothetical protein
MPTTIDHSAFRFTPEEIDRRLSEALKREVQEYRDFWQPMIREQRKQDAAPTPGRTNRRNGEAR